MLEICFSDSEKGALKAAQRCGNRNGRNEATASGVIGYSKLNWFDWFKSRKAIAKLRAEHNELKKLAISLGGKREDVIALSFELCMGDIASPIDLNNCPRKDLIFEYMTAYPVDDEDLKHLEDYAHEHWKNYVSDLEKLKNHASTGGQVRIWSDSTPSTACGLLFVADLLLNTDVEITIVPSPKNYTFGKFTQEYRGWGDVSSELFGHFLTDAVILSKEQIEIFSKQWRDLQAENATLRAVEDEKVISVKEDYYDDLIRKEFPSYKCKVGEIIGNVIEKHNICINCDFIANRIKVLIKKGELELLDENTTNFYRTTIRTVK